MAALIIVGDDMPKGRVLGLEWPEFLVRRAARSGAAHVVLLVDRVPRALVAAVDRMRADGIAIDLVRNAADAADRLHPDEAVLVMSGCGVVAQAMLDRLARAVPPAVLAIPNSAPSEAYERIDAMTQWAGGALLEGAAIRATAATMGDWDMASTLLRQAVQTGAARISVEDGVEVLPLLSPAAAVVASRMLTDAVALPEEGWGETMVISPIARAIALNAFDQSLAINRIVPWVALGGFGATLLAAALKLPAPAGIALAIGCIALRLVDHVGAATHLRSFLAQYLARVRDGTAVSGLLLLTLPSRIDHAPLALAVTLAALGLMTRRLRVPDPPRWLADLPGHALVIAFGGLFGSPGLEVALAAAASHAIVSLGWLQNRLSTVLITPR